MRFGNYMIHCLLPALLLTAAADTCAQHTTTVDSLFFRGVQAYEDGQYDQSLEIMQMLDKLYPRHARKTASLLMQGKTLYKLARYDESLNAFRKIKTNYPESDYVDDALYGEGTCLYRTGEAIESVRRFLQVVEQSGDARLQVKAAKLSSEVMEKSLTAADLKVLLEKVLTEKSKAAVTIKLAQKELSLQNFLTAKSYLQSFLDMFPQSEYDERIRALLGKAEEYAAGEFSVGVILPLSGPTAESGRRLLDGIRFAVDQHNANNSTQVRLVIEDSGGNIVLAVKAAQKLCGSGEILALIGELESDKTAAVAAVAQERGVPCFAPTASMDGIAGIGSCIYQLNSTLSVQAELLARYVVLEQKKTKLAVLYPADEYGNIMRNNFVETAKKLGADIIAEKWYFEGAENWENSIGMQIEAIREAGIRRMLDDSLLVRVAEDELDEEHADILQIQGVIGMNQTIESLVDSTNLAVTCIDGLFLPVSGAALEFVIPQVASKNIQTQLIGGSQWYDLDMLNEHRSDADGVIFPSDYFIDESNYNYYLLRNNFRTAMQRTPGQLEIYGYDAVQLLLTIIEGKSLSRENLRNGLAETGRIPVTHGIVQFNADGYNESLHLLKYRNGTLIKVK
ncbi:penicillin-binding protein activator [bacterium]|nr:penicillin-binding protein activator [bacterium]